jgi:hypothetical protein
MAIKWAWHNYVLYVSRSKTTFSLLTRMWKQRTYLKVCEFYKAISSLILNDSKIYQITRPHVLEDRKCCQITRPDVTEGSKLRQTANSDIQEDNKCANITRPRIKKTVHSAKLQGFKYRKTENSSKLHGLNISVSSSFYTITRPDVLEESNHPSDFRKNVKISQFFGIFLREHHNF